MERLRYDALDPTDRELLDGARTAARTAYAPYSGIRVGAALRTGSGAVIAASNVENAAYGATICAERAAVVRANAEGHRDFAVLAVTADGAALPAGQLVSPCGPCRQVLQEMAGLTGSSTRVLMTVVGTDEVVVAGLDELLPLPFGPLSR